MREFLLYAWILFCTLLVLGTEGLSLVRALALWPVLLLGWGGAFLLAWHLVGAPRGRPFPTLLFRDGWTLALAAAVGALVLAALLSSLWAPPMAWDGMVYHLPRQVRWLRQGSLEHFPTHVLAQLWHPPLGEILQAPLLLLTGQDHLLSLPSWGALVLSLLAASLMARELGAGLQGQWFAALLFVTVPAAYLQASDVKNDLLASLWSGILGWLALRILKGELSGSKAGVLVGCSLGLAILTKGTLYLLALPLLLFILAGTMVREGKRSWKPLVWIVGLALLLNTGHYLRNWSLFGSPLGPAEVRTLFRSQTLEPAALASGLLRHLSLHLGTPNAAANRFFTRIVVETHRHLGISPSDPRTTWPGVEYPGVFYEPADYNRAGAPVHLLFFAGMLLLWIPFRKETSREFFLLFVACAAGFLLYASVMKWSPTAGRFHLPVLLVLSGMMGAFYSRPRLRRLLSLLAAVLLLSLVTPFRWNPRSLLGPARLFRPELQLLFDGERTFQKPFAEAASYVNRLQPSVVGLYSQGAWSWEYPLMRLLRRSLYDPSFVAFNVTNVSGELARADPIPEVVVSLSPLGQATDQRSGIPYRETRRFDFISVLLPETAR